MHICTGFFVCSQIILDNFGPDFLESFIYQVRQVINHCGAWVGMACLLHHSRQRQQFQPVGYACILKRIRRNTGRLYPSLLSQHLQTPPQVPPGVAASPCPRWMRPAVFTKHVVIPRDARKQKSPLKSLSECLIVCHLCDILKFFRYFLPETLAD